MAHIHLAAKTLWRPIGFKEPLNNFSLSRYQRFIGVHVVNEWVALKLRHHFSKCIGLQHIVVVEQRNKLTRGHGQPVVRRRNNATIFCAVCNTNAVVNGRRTFHYFAGIRIGRLVVDQQEFPVAIGLCQHRGNAFLKVALLRVVHRCDHRNERAHALHAPPAQLRHCPLRYMYRKEHHAPHPPGVAAVHAVEPALHDDVLTLQKLHLQTQVGSFSCLLTRIRPHHIEVFRRNGHTPSVEGAIWPNGAKV